MEALSKAILCIQDTNKSKNTDMEEQIKKLLNLKGQKEGTQDAVKAENEIITVQYNPAAIRISGSEYSNYVSEDASKGSGSGTAKKQSIVPGELTLSIELVFYKGGNSIKKEVDALVSRLMENKAANVTFAWGELVFIGAVDSVQMEYTMFDQEGNPVRGSIHTDITQRADSRAIADYWDKLYKDYNMKKARG